MTVDRFGILRHRHEITFAGGRIRPLHDIEDTLSVVEKATHPDGYLYPPMQYTSRIVWTGGQEAEERIPGTERPALLRPLPATHEVEVTSPIESDFKRGDGAFLAHLAAYLFGTRVQFEDWTLDGRIPIAHPTHAVHVTPRVASEFFDRAYATWRSWSPASRRAFNTALYMHTKAPGYEWLWEAFLVEYMAFDAFWRLSGSDRTTHADRLRQMCQLYALSYSDQCAQEIVALRNQLLHEAIWEDATPGYGVTQHGWNCNTRLRALNQRIIATQLGWGGKYVASDWVDNQFFRFFE